MTSERDIRRHRAAQVGLLMRAYRESFISADGRRGLTQEGLLTLMASVDGEYAERFSHATVSRWESGATRPTVRRLRVFGKALDLSKEELGGLLLLAGLAADPHGATEQVFREPAQEKEPGLGIGDTVERWNLPATLAGFVFFRTLPLAICIVAGAYALSSLGWDDSWSPALYVGIAVGVVLAQGFLLPDPRAELREFFWVSLFFLLSTPLIQFAPLHMDHYNFYRVGDFAGTHLPYMLALLVNLALASSAGLILHLLRVGCHSRKDGGSGAFGRAALAVLSPLCLVYAVVVVISNVSVWIQLAVLMPVVGIVFMALLVVRDPSIEISERSRQFLLSATVAAAIVGASLGIATILVIYVSPDLPRVLPNHNLLASWEISFSELGYTREEALNRLDLGYMWHAMLVFAYMFFVVGGKVILDIYRIGDRHAEKLEAATSGAMPSTATADPARN